MKAFHNSRLLSKTDYILFRECPKNVWYKIHRPEIYNQAELSEFEKAIIETGNEVELVARKLFPTGVLIEDRGKESQEETQQLIAKKEKVIFQPIFIRDGFLAAVDILELNGDGTYNIYEVKSTTDVDKKTHFHDLAFQVNLLEKFGLKIKKAYVIHLNSEYIRKGEVNINQLFHSEDVTGEVHDIKEVVAKEMDFALKYLSAEEEPPGSCACIYKGRSSHCSTFKYANPKVPDYGVHDISRIGASKARLQELVDVGIFDIQDVPEDIKFSEAQKNQIEVYKSGITLIDRLRIAKELESLVFPLYFLDYETFPSAIPRFDGFSPYQQIPFQYSLYVLELSEARPRTAIRGRASDGLDSKLKHFEFLFSDSTDPTPMLLGSLKKHIGETGSIIVWSKRFECKINDEMAQRFPQEKPFIDVINKRVYDLMDIFSYQYYVHKDFKGRVSIKNIMPVLAPELSYKTLQIQEGGTASQKWNEAVNGNITPSEKNAILVNLKEYCKLDTYAMYAIWKHLYDMLY